MTLSLNIGALAMVLSLASATSSKLGANQYLYTSDACRLMNKEKTPSCLQLSYDSHLELDLPLTDQPSLYWSVLRIGWRDAVTSCFCWEKFITKKYFYIRPLEVRKVTFLKVGWGLKCIPASQEPSAMIHYPIQS